jgi:hypothetical protein
MDDAELIKEAGACVNCPHFEAEDDFKENREKRTCQYRACFDRKVQAFGERTLHNLTQLHPKALKVAERYYGNAEIPGLEDYEVVAQREPGAIPAVIVKGSSENIGKEVWVAPKKQKGQRNDLEAERKAAEKLANKYRANLLSACLEVDAWPVFQPDDIKALLQHHFNRFDWATQHNWTKVLGWTGDRSTLFEENTRGWSMAQFYRLAHLFTLDSRDVKIYPQNRIEDPADLEALAARIGVNAAAIRAAVYDPAPKES